ncbi:hypothetical protein C0991_009156 [Blastosporella zonata]|nr:hypothetical protein C0991_009156 [Blastosporella zonata]
MDKDLAIKVEDFRKGVATRGEDIVFKRFPSKLLYALKLARELDQLVQTTLATESPFHMSHAETSTDATVYPPPTDSLTNGPAPKKRKRDDDAQIQDAVTPRSDLQHAKIPSLILANRHMSDNVHSVVKKECVELAEMTVRPV